MKKINVVLKVNGLPMVLGEMEIEKASECSFLCKEIPSRLKRLFKLEHVCKHIERDLNEYMFPKHVKFQPEIWLERVEKK